MEWFSQKTSIAAIQIPNWGFILRNCHCNLAGLLTHALSRSGSEPDHYDSQNPGGQNRPAPAA